MARLFIGPREMNFVSDIAKEIVKDVNGQVIYYYPISEIKTKAHDLYKEAIEKVYDNPIAIDAFVDAQYQGETKINQFGVDSVYKIEAFVQYRDLVDKEIRVNVGDFFSFSDIFYEITATRVLRNIFGQAEHKDGVVLIGTKARDQQFKAPIQGPTDIRYTDDDAVQTTFVQQRGESEIDGVETGDKRDVQEVIDKPLTGPNEVSEKGALSDNSHYESSFYDEDR
jgi:hypothetical protein